MLSQQIGERRDSDKSQPETARQSAPGAKPPEARPPGQNARTETKQAGQAGASEKSGTGARDREETAAEAVAVPPTATELLAQAAAAMHKPLQITDAAAPATMRDGGLAASDASLTGMQALLAGSDQALRQAPAAVGTDAIDFKTSLQEAAQLQATTDVVSGADGKELSKLTELAATTMQEAPESAGAVTQLPPGVQQIAQSIADKPMDRLAPRVGTPGWDQALGQKVVWMVAGAQQSASLTLNPPDLGPLQVVLNVNNGQADASFYAAQPEVRQALEAALPKLRDMMSQAGVELGQASVSAGMPDRHDQPGGHAAQQAGRGGNTGKGGDDSLPVPARAQQLITGQGLIDTFV